MSRLHAPRRSMVFLALALVAAMVVSGSTVYAFVKKNGGPVTAVRTVSETGLIYTTSSIPTPIPGMSLTVDVPAGAKALLIITLSAETSCFASQYDAITYSECMVAIRVNNTGVSPGGSVFSAARDGLGEATRRAGSMQWIHGPLGPGQYTVTADFFLNSGDNQGFMRMWMRTLTVLRSAR